MSKFKGWLKRHAIKVHLFLAGYLVFAAMTTPYTFGQMFFSLGAGFALLNAKNAHRLKHGRKYPKWQWRRPKNTHRKQPRLDLLVEDVMIFAALWLAHRAEKREDAWTLRRMDALMDGAGKVEEAEERSALMVTMAEHFNTDGVVDGLRKGFENAGKAVAKAVEQMDFREFNSSAKFHSAIARERRKGRTFVTAEANRVRREMGLPAEPGIF